MKKILHILTSSHIGGTERMLLNFLSKAQNKQFHYEVATLSKNGRGPLLTELKKQRIITFDLYKEFNNKLAGPLITAVKLYKLIKQRRIELVHIYGVTANTIARPAAKLAKIKIITGLRGDFGPYRSRLHIFIERLQRKLIDAWIANSEYAKKMSVLRDGAKENNVYIAYNGIDYEKWHNPQINQQNNMLKIVTVANLHKYKGHVHLVHAIARLSSDQKKHLSVKFIGRDEMQGRIQSLIKSFNLTPIIQCTGYMPNPMEEIQKSDLFILPSETESFPNSILEAMAAGKPVISTTAGGIRELVIPNETGLLVPSGNDEELEKALCLFIAKNGKINHDLLKKLGNNGQKRVQTFFSLKKMVMDTEIVYKKLLLD